MYCKKTVLENGVTVVTDSMPDVRSVSLGLWFNVGSRDERPDQAGLTHFMEHMMFKGTPTRTAFDISTRFDALGAELNAFTSKEYTCYYARFVDDKLESALDVLADMVMNSSFSQETIDPEREVVLEEIARTQDAPDDFVYDLFSEAMLPNHPLGLPVLGTRELVGGYEHADCAAFHDQHYYSGNMTVAAAGNVDHDILIGLVEKAFSGMRRGDKATRSTSDDSGRVTFTAQKKETEQAHVLYGMPWMSFDDPRRFAGIVMSSMLGGSMSSRLFQEVREKRGLVYAIYANPMAYQGLGLYGIYAGTRPDNIGRVVGIVRDELAKMAESGTDAEELSRTVESLCGQLLLSLESTNARMVRLGRAETLGSKHESPEELVQHYRVVSCENVKEIAERMLMQDPTVAVISPLEPEEVRAVVSKELGI
jgi:predicted Zn-dependent peptidase